MVDILLLVIIAAVTWCVASEGAWGAAILFVIVLLSGLLAMNFFEPMANFLQIAVSNAPSWSARWDMISFLLIFAILVFGFRFGAEYLQPNFLAVQSLVYDGARWGFGALTGYVVMAILLTSLHMSAMPRNFMGFTPERDNFFGVAAPDRQWLGFTQYVSEKSLSRSGAMKIFDGPAGKKGDYEGVWPSFPIRYASRRETLQTGQAAAGAGTGEVKTRRGSGKPKSRSGGGF